VCCASAPMIMSLVYSAASVVLITIKIFGLALALFTEAADGCRVAAHSLSVSMALQLGMRAPSTTFACQHFYFHSSNPIISDVKTVLSAFRSLCECCE